MNVAIKKVGQRDGREWFVLVDDQTRQVITVKDVTESSLRRFFEKRKVRKGLIDKCLERARRRYAESSQSAPVDHTADTMGDDDLLFELGLDSTPKK